MKYKTRYCNTDLDIIAPQDLTPLAEALSQRGLYTFHVHQWENGLWSARFETEEPFQEPDANIAAMLTAIESLEEPARSLWQACIVREFDIGYDCGKEPQWFRQQLSPETITRMAASGGAVVLTLYPVLDRDTVDAAVKILKKDKNIKSHIGSYKRHSYNYVALPSSKKNLTEVKVTLFGTKGSVYVHCRMELTTQPEWIVKEIIKKEERKESSL